MRLSANSQLPSAPKTAGSLYRPPLVSVCNRTKGVVADLRVGVHGLSAPEAGLVRALVVLSSHGGADFRWRFAADGPYDALIVGAAVDAAAPPARFLGWLGDEGTAAPGGMHLLARPLQAAGLEAWLRGLERAISAGAAAPAPVPAPPPESTPAPGPARMLRRWPPEALLRNDPRHLRAAALLARRGLAAHALADQSGLGEHGCRAFLRALDEQGLLGPPAAGSSAVFAPGIASALRARLQP